MDSCFTAGFWQALLRGRLSLRAPLVCEMGTAPHGGWRGLGAVMPLRPSGHCLPRPGACSAPTALTTAFSASRGRRRGESLYKVVGLRALKRGWPPGPPRSPESPRRSPWKEVRPGDILLHFNPQKSLPMCRRSPEEGNGNPLQYSCLGNPVDRGAWWATVHGVT